MVATTKGPADGGSEKPRKKNDGTTKRKPTTDDQRLQKALGFSDEEWGHLVSHARSRSSTPADAIRSAVEATYGRPMTAELQQDYGPGPAPDPETNLTPD